MAQDISPAMRLKKEAALLLGLFALAVLSMPAAIYAVGHAVFGDYGDGDLFDLYADLWSRMAAMEPALWFLFLSPYLVGQALRLTLLGFRRIGRSTRLTRSNHRRGVTPFTLFAA
ncbi:MAG: hypothetical protein U5K76_06010 [Woeseiaceae bacterium]|nr:hypothetical protein [Woeseiaceae bacterium]